MKTTRKVIPAINLNELGEVSGFSEEFETSEALTLWGVKYLLIPLLLCCSVAPLVIILHVLGVF